MRETVYDQRQQEQRNREAAKADARRLYPDAKVSPSAHVQFAEGGAFVEIEVWIPLDAIGKVTT